MESSDSYYSIAGESHSSVREKASRFTAYVYPVTREEEVKVHLENLKKEYYNANHHCYAYRIGHPDTAVYRIYDDGEPSGSAGKPIYGQILSRNLSDLLVVVTRYFGGTKLGIPGLIQAYKTVTSDALGLNTVITKIVTQQLSVRFPVQQMNDVMRILKQEEAVILSQDYREDYSIHFSIRKSRVETIENRLALLANISTYK